jgi:hypothetical protein
MRRLLLISIMLVCMVAVAAAPEGKFLCLKDEQVVFGCNLSNKVLSLCASNSSSASPTFQYRFGAPGHLELQFPNIPGPAKDHFWFSSTAFSGGGSAHIRFVNTGYEYVLFDSTVRTNFGKSGRHDPRFDAGIVVLHEGKTVSIRYCTNDASIHAVAYEQMPREEYQDYEEIP